MTRRLIVIAAFVLAALVAMLYVVAPELFTAEGRNARFLRQVDRSGTIQKRSCYSMEAFVDVDRWSRFGASDQERVTKSLAAYCLEQGSTGQMTIVDTV